MNPLVKDMLETAHSHDIELRFLEDLFEEDCKCESQHNNWGDTCSKQVTHLFQAHVVQKKVCESAASRIERAGKSVACQRCGKYIADCWTITPI